MGASPAGGFTIMQGFGVQEGRVSDETDQPREPQDEPGIVSGRRGVLMLGAISASMVVTIRPALAQSAGSILACEIPVPESGGAGDFIAADGRLVTPDTPGAFPPAARAFTGEEVKAALRGRSLPGTSYRQSQAYTNYIRRLQHGMSGFTCYASLQRPR